MASMGLPTMRAAAAWARLWPHSEPSMTGMVKAPTARLWGQVRSGRRLLASQAITGQTSNWASGNQVLPFTTRGVPNTRPTTVTSSCARTTGGLIIGQVSLHEPLARRTSALLDELLWLCRRTFAGRP